MPRPAAMKRPEGDAATPDHQSDARPGRTERLVWHARGARYLEHGSPKLDRPINLVPASARFVGGDRLYFNGQIYGIDDYCELAGAAVISQADEAQRDRPSPSSQAWTTSCSRASNGWNSIVFEAVPSAMNQIHAEQGTRVAQL